MRGSERTTLTRGTRRSFAALGAILGCTLLAIACQNEPLSDGVELQPPMDHPMMTIGSCSNSDPGGDSFVRYWNCGQSVTVRQSGTGPDLSSAISNAAGAWSLGYGLPSFSYTSGGSANIVVNRHGTSGSNMYCGVTNPNTGAQIDVYPAGTDCTSRNLFYTGTPNQLLLHEFGHAVGLQSNYHNFDVSGYTDHCAINLPSGTGSLLTANELCAAETEEVLYKYGVRGSAPDWGNYFIKNTMPSVSSSVVLVGGSVTASDTLLVTDNGMTALPLCPGDEGWRCLPLGSASISWSAAGSGNPAGAVSISGSGSSVSVTGVTVGGVLLTATLTGTGGYQTTTGFEDLGFHNLAGLTVDAPTLSLISGSGQNGLPNTPLSDSVVVRLTYAGAGVAGRTVTFAVTSGGGNFSPSTSTTDGSGYARSQWTLGSGTGSKGGTATVSGATPSSLTLTATAVTLAAPTAFHHAWCDLYLDGSDTTIVRTFTWTAASLPGWEVGMAATNDSASASVVGSGASGTAFAYGPFAKGGFPKGSKYFFIREVFGASRSAWSASTNNPINVTGSIAGCQW